MRARFSSEEGSVVVDGVALLKGMDSGSKCFHFEDEAAVQVPEPNKAPVIVGADYEAALATARTSRVAQP